MTNQNEPSPGNETIEHYDAVIIGAGVSGMYALHHLREMGLSVRVVHSKAHARHTLV